MDTITTFRNNLAEVDRLVNFDKEVLQIVTLTIADLHQRLKGQFADERVNGGRALTVIRGIRDNASIRSKYAAVFNQAVVLLVSHLASALDDLFRDAVTAKLQSIDPGKLLDEEVKLSFADMREKDWNLKLAAADLLISKYDLSFQDMGSTVKAFKNYVGVIPVRNEVMNNIITAQACRHVIVHAGGRVSERAVRQVSNANPRTLRPTLRAGEILQFTAAEVEAVKADMLMFVENLGQSVSSLSVNR